MSEQFDIEAAREAGQLSWNEDRKLDLLPCPFCGADPVLLHYGNDLRPRRKVMVRCPKCRVGRADATIHQSFQWLESIAERHWNRRDNREQE